MWIYIQVHLLCYYIHKYDVGLVVRGVTCCIYGSILLLMQSCGHLEVMLLSTAGLVIVTFMFSGGLLKPRG
jgi:hypothetical protein